MTFRSKIKFAKNLIRKYIAEYPDKCAVSCSFGKDSMVLYHLVKRIKKDIPVIVITTPFKPQETIKYRDKMIKKYGMNAQIFSQPERTDIPEWWKSNPEECCAYYKVKSFEQALQNYDCWFTGLRRSESKGRAELDYVIPSDRFGKIKVNPILDFNEAEIWKYLAVNHIPVNPLYKKGYRSLGCKPCSRPERSDYEEERAGRWKGTKKCGGECGIHSRPKIDEQPSSNTQNNIV